jgi:hypothetical protein
MSTVESASRAPRFALDVPVRVRRLGAAEWQSGQTVNISRSGLLAAVPGSFRRHDTIEAIVELSRANASVSDVMIRGRVARVTQAGILTQLGTTIDEYRLQRADPSDPSDALTRRLRAADDCLSR